MAEEGRGEEESSHIMKNTDHKNSHLVRFLLLCVFSGRLLQQGGDDVIGDVKELLVDLLILAEVVVSDGGKYKEIRTKKGQGGAGWVCCIPIGTYVLLGNNIISI